MASVTPAKNGILLIRARIILGVRTVSFMRRLANAVAALLLASGLLIFSVSASAQVHGVPAGATSFPAGFTGFHGNFPPGIPAGATSLGPRGFIPVRPFNPLNRFDGRGFRPDRLGRRHLQPFFIPLGYSPFYYDISSVPGYDFSTGSYSPQTQPSGDAGAPSKVEITLVDKRSDPAGSETSPVASNPRTAASPAPVEESIAKTLVMRDGSKREIRNYAILGKNIFDLSEGRSRRIPLDDVDLPATTKVNEENGVDFKLP